MVKAPSKVATFVGRHIDASEKTQTEIAAEVGFPRPNMVAMIKTGVTKVPLARIAKLAKALDIDPVELFRMAMAEYMPDLLEVCDEIYGRDKLTTGETELLKRLRLHTKGKNFKVTGAVNDAIDDLAKAMK